MNLAVLWIANHLRVFLITAAAVLLFTLSGAVAFAVTSSTTHLQSRSAADADDSGSAGRPTFTPTGSPSAGAPTPTASVAPAAAADSPASETPASGPKPADPAPAAAVAPDTAGPMISVGTLPRVINGFVGCVASGFTVTATDPSGVASVTVSDNHPDVWISQYWQTGDQYGFSGNALSEYGAQSVGAAQVVTAVITAVDPLGNPSSVTRTFNYWDWSSYCTET